MTLPPNRFLPWAAAPIALALAGWLQACATDTPGGTAGQGDAGQTCYPNSTCNGTLVCTNSVCVEPTLAVGEQNGPCYPNSTCNAGFDCLDGTCVEPPAADTGTADSGSGATDTDVDGGDDGGGDTSTDTAPASICGNGVVEAGEDCDEVPTPSEACAYGETACQVCTEDCQLVPGAARYCGDGTLDAEEVCDPGASEPADSCGPDCDCGTGYHLEAGSCLSDTRPCDLANAAVATELWDPVAGSFGRCEALRCSAGYSLLDGGCVAVGCGNGVVEAGEGCDDGNLIREDGCTAYCQIAACGDGILREGVEECDDGNTETEVCRYGETSCSVCAPDCRSIAGATSYCGDRIVDAAEVCDDGNAYDTDACTQACLCGSGFHLEAGVCANNTRSCRVENATFARQTWNGSGYGPCTPVNCAPAFHVAADRCDPDEIACTAPNAASAVQRWDGSAYGECLVLGCADDYHLESGVCLSNRRACTLANATAATQGWNPDTLSYGGCEASTCAAGYRPQFGTCVAGYAQVDAGDQHVCAVLADGVVHCWGRNIEGQLGDGTTTSRTRPVRVVGLPPAVQVSVESASTCALTRTGVVFCWGTGIFGRTGVLASTPTTVPLPLAARSLSGGSSHHCAVLADQTPRCWGSSQQGQLGVVDGQLNTIVQPTTFADGTGVASVAQISAGYRHSCVIQTDGTGQCWGLNNYGQIGLGYSSGGTNNTRLPGEIVGLITGVEIAAGEYHTCARLAEGTVKCWGVGYAIGDGYNGNRAQPVGTVGLESAISIAAGSGFSCAVLDAGAPAARSVKCWGTNNNGALGNGTIGSPALTPIDTLGLADPVAVTAGTNFACALESDATISCWGPNDYGQLGDGTTTQRLTPVAVQSATACGDGIVAPSEVCDTAQLSGRTCDSLGFGGGPIACLSDCSGYNTSSCVAASVCGDNAIGGSEVCDGSDLDGLDCLDFGFASGMLDCASDCSSFVDARCSFDVCGNGVKEPTEACDGTDFGGDSCLSRGFYTGGLLCSSDCTVNAWQCTNSTTAWQSKPYTTFPSGSGAISGVISRADPADGPARGSFYDVYRFDVTGSSVRATIRVNSPDFSPSVLVYRAGLDASIGSASSPSGADATVVLEGQRISPTIVGPLQRGAYYVVVSAAGIGVTGQYSVSVYQSTF